MYVVAKPYTDPGMQRKLEWVARMLDASKASAAKIGCSPEAIVAQAAQETGWGRAAIGNNVFGIKASSGWKGMVVMRPTWEVENGAVVHIVAPFRDYPTLADGIEDHFQFLKNNSRYRNVFDHDNTMSDQEYFRRLAADGYATDPNYAQRLSDVLDAVNVFKSRLSEDGVLPWSPPPRLMMIGVSPGPDVVELQKALGITADGDFGPDTKRAVMEWQRTHPACGDVDGVVGVLTRMSLGGNHVPRA